MSMLKDAWRTGQRKSDKLKEQVYYYLFGLMCIGVYVYGGWTGVAVFYVAMVLADYVIMKYEGDL